MEVISPWTMLHKAKTGLSDDVYGVGSPISPSSVYFEARSADLLKSVLFSTSATSSNEFLVPRQQSSSVKFSARQELAPLKYSIAEKNYESVLCALERMGTGHLETEERERLLKLVADSLNSGFGEAVIQAAEAFCRHGKWKYFEIWSLDRNSNLLEAVHEYLSVAWLSDESSTSKMEMFRRRSSRFKIGTGLPGRVWATQKPEWISCITDVRRFARADSAFRCGLEIAFGVPIRLHDRPSSVIVFFDSEKRIDQVSATKTAMELFSLVEHSWQINGGEVLSGSRTVSSDSTISD